MIVTWQCKMIRSSFGFCLFSDPHPLYHLDLGFLEYWHLTLELERNRKLQAIKSFIWGGGSCFNVFTLLPKKSGVAALG